MISERVLNDFEAILDDAYPKSKYAGDFISVENTIENLTAKVVADEETDIVVSNKNLLSINENLWQLTEDNTVKNLQRNNGSSLTQKNILLKAGHTLHIGLILKSIPTTNTTIGIVINDSYTTAYSFVNFNNYDLDTLYTKSYTAEEDCVISFRTYGNTNSETFEFQIWAIIDEEIEKFELHKEQTFTGTEVEFKTYNDTTHIYNTANVNMTVTARTRKE